MQLPAYRWRFVHLAALWGYGVSQPVFSMLKGNPEFLVVRGSSRGDVVLFALMLAFVPPAVVVVVEALTGWASQTLSGALHVVAVWGFGFLAVLQLTRLIGMERGAALLLPCVPALLAAFLYLKLRPFRTFLAFSFLLPVAGVVGFVASVPLATDDAAAADVRVAHPVPVVLVVFDEFPVSSILRSDGSIDAVRYPNFARLAREGTWYPNATTVHESTTQAVPAILTGIEPRHGQLPTLADHPDNLFTLLGGTFAIRASEQLTRLCPTRFCPSAGVRRPLADRQRGLLYDVAVGYLHRVLPDTLAGALPPIGERWGAFGAGSDDLRSRVVGALDPDAWMHLAGDALYHSHRARQFAAFVGTLEKSVDRTPLYFEHSLLPHAPWRFLPSGRAYPNEHAVLGLVDDWTRWRSSMGLVNTALGRHLLQVGYTDRLLGLVLRRLVAIGLYDRALVIVTADHGESFKPNVHPRIVVKANLSDIAGVPLFVKYPSQRRGRIDGRDAKTIDIVPTIADVLGVRIPWHVDGVSLRDAPVSRPVKVSKLDGDPIVGDPRAVEAGVLATARRNASLFGVGNHSMYRLGPFQNLYGKPIESLASNVVPAGAARVTLDDEQIYGNVRLLSGLVPTRVAGEIRGGSIGQGTALAVAVNGRVEATTRSYRLDGRTRFVTLVPEHAFHDGRNAVRVYAVERTGGHLRIQSLGGTPDATTAAHSSVAVPDAIPSRARGEGG